MSKVERATFRACFGGWALDGMDFQFYSFIIPSLIAGWHLSKAQAGTLQTSTLLASALGGWMAGLIADRIGRVRTLQITILWFALFTGLCGLAQSYGQLLAARSLMGLGFGGEWAAGAVLMGEVIAARHRGKAVGAVQSGWALGWGAGRLLRDHDLVADVPQAGARVVGLQHRRVPRRGDRRLLLRIPGVRGPLRPARTQAQLLSLLALLDGDGADLHAGPDQRPGHARAGLSARVLRERHLQRHGRVLHRAVSDAGARVGSRLQLQLRARSGRAGSDRDRLSRRFHAAGARHRHLRSVRLRAPVRRGLDASRDPRPGAGRRCLSCKSSATARRCSRCPTNRRSTWLHRWRTILPRGCSTPFPARGPCSCSTIPTCST